ncbi:MAG: zinc metallopeptidase [Candidatus Sumerlaeota bacterium]|nr:zinc metallopeptidase [Candidatus Sumerlaeota bacterium]
MGYLLIVFLPTLLLSLYAQFRVRHAFSKHSKVNASSGLTGAEAAAAMLRAAGLADRTAIERVDGFLSDHYNPRKKTLRLSPDVYDNASLAAVGVACHEAGHAIQDARKYAPLVLRNAIVPTASIGSSLGYILIIAGLFLQWANLSLLGLALFGAVVVFQIVNLPVEFNASAHAREMTARLGIVRGQTETAAVSSVLSAAAMTYVAATAAALVNLLYYAWMILGNRE